MLASTLIELKGKLRLSELLLCKIPLARKMSQCGNKAEKVCKQMICGTKF